MGTYSWDCKGCGHPMLSIHAAKPVNQWMIAVVVIEQGGSVLQGDYDGYGRVDDRDIDTSKMDWENPPKGNPCCWHRACWMVAKQPMEYSPSRRSADQGWFFKDQAHDMEEPKVPFVDVVLGTQPLIYEVGKKTGKIAEMLVKIREQGGSEALTPLGRLRLVPLKNGTWAVSEQLAGGGWAEAHPAETDADVISWIRTGRPSPESYFDMTVQEEADAETGCEP